MLRGMTDYQAGDEPQGMVGALLAPLRLPGRVVADIETIAGAVLGLEQTAGRHLASVDAAVGELIQAIAKLQATVSHIDGNVMQMTSLESTLQEEMRGLRNDVNTRMVAVEEEVQGMRAPLDQMALDLQSVKKLLPDPNDGPLARLKDTLTSS